MVTPGTVIYDDQNGQYYVFLGTLNDKDDHPVSIDLGATGQYAISSFAQAPTADTPVFAPFTAFAQAPFDDLISDLPDFASFKSAGDGGTGSSSTAVGAIFVLNAVTSATLAYESGATLSAGAGATAGAFGGAISITAKNTSSIAATNTSSITVSNGTSGPTATSPGTGLAVNGIIATNNILDSADAFGLNGSLTASGADGAVGLNATSNASIDAQNTASTDAKSTSVGVVLAFNTIGVKQPVAGFLENTVDALFGTDLAGEQPDQVYAYLSGATTKASDGIGVNAAETSTITSTINNAETGLFSSGVSVAATVALNRIATDVEAWITGGMATASGGDIVVAGQAQSSVTSTVTTPVVKLALNFGKSSGNSNATTIGVSIARNIIDNTLSAAAGTSSGGTTLTASDGNIAITANQLSTIEATSASAAISLGVTTSGSAGSFAGGGAVAINTIVGSDTATSLNSTLSATAVDPDTGAITVSATYGGEITSLVAALAAAVTVGDGAGDAIAIGAAVSVNLIGWRGMVADETEDSSAPIILSATIDGGSASADSALDVTSTSNAAINATTAAAAVAVSVSTGGGSSSGQESSGGDSPTDADQEGEGSTATAAGGETNTDVGGADGATVNEGADVGGGAETNQSEAGGAAAGEAGNTAGAESGASQGSASSESSGLGSGGGLIAGAGGVISAATGGASNSSPTYTTTQSSSPTDAQTLNNGDTVQVAAGYTDPVSLSGGGAGPTFSVGSGNSDTHSTVDPGAVVEDSGTYYRYVGPAALTDVDFEIGATPPDFTSTTNGQANWIEIGGTDGHIYQYIGPSGAALDLNNQNYSDASLWSDITGGSSSGGSGSTSAPSGDTPSLGAGLTPLSGGAGDTPSPSSGAGSTDPSGASNPSEPATSTTPSQGSESSDSNSGLGLTAAGVYTENKIAASISSTIESTSEITIGHAAKAALNVAASDSAAITSLDGAAAVSGDFSASGKATTVAIGIGIARNTLQDSVAASVSDAGEIDAAGAPITLSATHDDQIQATSVAASLAFSASDQNAVSVAGGASLADNLIGGDTTALLSNTSIGQSGAATGALSVLATDSSTINATVAAASAAVSFSSQNATAVGIGASLAHNRIGDGTDTGAGAVTAAIDDSAVFAGAVDVSATSSETVDALVLAASVAISGSSQAATGFTGAGAFAFNEIALDIGATIDGGAVDPLSSAGVSVAAADTSTIEATVFAGSVAGGFSSENATTVAIGVSFARNSITNPVTAYIEDVPLLTTGGGAVSVTASEDATIDAISSAIAIGVSGSGENSVAFAGGGALAANFVEATAEAYVDGSTLGDSAAQVGAVTVTATDSSAIEATIAALALAGGIGGSGGTAVGDRPVARLQRNRRCDRLRPRRGARRHFRLFGRRHRPRRRRGACDGDDPGDDGGGGRCGFGRRRQRRLGRRRRRRRVQHGVGGDLGLYRRRRGPFAGVRRRDGRGFGHGLDFLARGGRRPVGFARRVLGGRRGDRPLDRRQRHHRSGEGLYFRRNLADRGRPGGVGHRARERDDQGKILRRGGRLRDRRRRGRFGRRRRRDGGEPDRRDDLGLYRRLRFEHGRRRHGEGDGRFRH